MYRNLRRAALAMFMMAGGLAFAYSSGRHIHPATEEPDWPEGVEKKTTVDTIGQTCHAEGWCLNDGGLTDTCHQHFTEDVDENGKFYVFSCSDNQP